MEVDVLTVDIKGKSPRKFELSTGSWIDREAYLLASEPKISEIEKESK